MAGLKSDPPQHQLAVDACRDRSHRRRVVVTETILDQPDISGSIACPLGRELIEADLNCLNN